MKGTIDALQRGFESAPNKTPEFLAFARTFKREFKKQVEAYHLVEGWKWSVNHFEVSGFFRVRGGACYYFATGDVRGFAQRRGLLLRSARDFRDFTGGPNTEQAFSSFEFMMRLPAPAFTGAPAMA